MHPAPAALACAAGAGCIAIKNSGVPRLNSALRYHKAGAVLGLFILMQGSFCTSSPSALQVPRQRVHPGLVAIGLLRLRGGKEFGAKSSQGERPGGFGLHLLVGHRDETTF